MCRLPCFGFFLGSSSTYLSWQQLLHPPGLPLLPPIQQFPEGSIIVHWGASQTGCLYKIYFHFCYRTFHHKLDMLEKLSWLGVNAIYNSETCNYNNSDMTWAQHLQQVVRYITPSVKPQLVVFLHFAICRIKQTTWKWSLWRRSGERWFL